MTASARDIAGALRERLPGVGVKKVHKLLYYAQGHHLAAFGRPLFSESIRAWDMGPVVAELWRNEDRGEPRPEPHVLGEAELNTIGYVASQYGRLNGSQLERLTHRATMAGRGRPTEGWRFRPHRTGVDLPAFPLRSRHHAGRESSADL